MRAIGRAVTLSLIVAGAAQAQDWIVMNGAEITEVLTDRSVTYDNGATQRFFASGRTLYTHGEPSWGSWRVEGNEYCSLWPPSPDWDCYAVQSANPDGIVFLDDFGNRFEGRIHPQ